VFFFFFIRFFVSNSVEKSTRLRPGPFEIPKRQGVRRNACEKKSALLVGQRRCCSFPSSGLRHSCAPPPTGARTPTLVRLVHVKICRVCAHNAYTHLPYVHVYGTCVCVRATSCALDHPPVHPLRKLGVVLSRQAADLRWSRCLEEGNLYNRKLHDFTRRSFRKRGTSPRNFARDADSSFFYFFFSSPVASDSYDFNDVIIVNFRV